MAKQLVGRILIVLIGMVGFGVGCASDEASVGSVEQEVAPQPQNLTGVAISPTGIQLMWDPVPTATRYVLMRGPTPGSETSYTTHPATPTTYTNNHINPGEQTCWQVKSVVGAEVSIPSNEVCITTPGVPGPPTNISATPISSSRIVIAWDAVPNATRYFVYQSDTAMGTYTSIGSTTGTNLTAVNLQPSTTYFFRVQTIFSGGGSPQSDPPVSATTFAEGAAGYWRYDEDGGTTANDSSGFNRHGTLVNGAAFTSTTKAPISNNPSAINFPGGASAVTIPNNAVFNLASDFTVALWVNVSAAGDVKLVGKRRPPCSTISWELAQDATNGLHFRSTSTVVPFGTTLPVGAWTHVAVTRSGGTVQTYVNGAATGSGAYTTGSTILDGVQLGNSGSCGGVAHAGDEVLILTRAMTPAEVAAIGDVPDAPTNLVGTVEAPTRIRLDWDAVPNAEKYVILRGTAAGNAVFYTNAPPVNTYTNGHMQPNETSSWQVAVVVNNLLSAPSNEVVLTTDPPPPAPTNLVATPVSQTRINLTWDAVTGAGKYFVFQSVGANPPAFKGTALTNSFGATGLSANTMYTYTVRAVSAADNTTTSVDSAPASATTLP